MTIKRRKPRGCDAGLRGKSSDQLKCKLPTKSPNHPQDPPVGEPPKQIRVPPSHFVQEVTRPALATELPHRPIEASNSLADLTVKIKVEHEATVLAFKRGIEHAITCGHLLIEAKTQVLHGAWRLWLDEHCRVPERTAQLYMRLARNQDWLKSATVADLSVRDAVALLALPKPKEPKATEEQVEPAAEARPRAALDESHSKRLSRPARWAEAATAAREALETLQSLQEAYQEWKDSLPENLANTAVSEKLDAVCELDLAGAAEIAGEAEGIDLPLGFGRDD